MVDQWDEDIFTFIKLCSKHNVRMLMVGGGAVNFHGYQRHSADVDFWLDTVTENLDRLKSVFHEMGYELTEFPEKVKNQEQNISLKFSPGALYIELITNFNPNKSFEQAYSAAVEQIVKGEKILKWKVLSLDDLITSKVKAGRPKDLLDIQELKRVNP